MASDNYGAGPLESNALRPADQIGLDVTTLDAACV